MRCPKCGSENTEILSSTETKGFGAGKGILGLICFGPIGLICGLCGMGKSKTEHIIYCNNCGKKSKL